MNIQKKPEVPDSGWQEVGKFVSSKFLEVSKKRKLFTWTIKKPKFISSGYYSTSESLPRQVTVEESEPATPPLLDIDLSYFDKPVK